MELSIRIDEARDERVITLRIPNFEMSRAFLTPEDRQMVTWFEQQPDVEAKLMALHIYVRRIEASNAKSAAATHEDDGGKGV